MSEPSIAPTTPDIPQQTAAEQAFESATVLGSDENARAALNLAKERAGEKPGLTEQQVDTFRRMVHAENYRRATEAPSTVVEQVRKIAAESGTIHDIAARLPDPLNPVEEPTEGETGETAESAEPSDWDANAFGTAIGLPSVQGLSYESADGALADAKKAISAIADTVNSDELLAAWDSFGPERQQALLKELGNVVDHELSPLYGLTGEREQSHEDALEALALNCLRIGLGHNKLGREAPPIDQLVARARLIQDDDWKPGARGHQRKVAEPKRQFKNIYEVCQAMHNW